MTFDELLKQDADSLMTFTERRKELENVLLQLTEKIDKNFEKVVVELREIFQKFPYCNKPIVGRFEKDGYELKILAYRDANCDNFICLKKGSETLIKIYKYEQDVSINKSDYKESFGKAFVLQNLEKIKSMILQVLCSVVKSNDEYRKHEIERLEKEVNLLGSAIIQNKEEEQWSDYISYVLQWCSENLQKTDRNILPFDEWKII